MARERLLDVGLQRFAAHGFAKTSIRQIANAAGTNVASVGYCFGNKAGLYRAACSCDREPSGLWKKQVDRGLRPLHEALVALRCKRMGVETPDDELQALALLVIAPALHPLLNSELIHRLAPCLLGDDRAVDAWCGRLRRNAELLIAEASRSRGASASPRPSRSPA